MRFAEFHQGQLIECGPRLVDADEIVAFARSWDPQWFHCDPSRAADGRWQGLIASGWHSCAIAMRLAYDGVLAGSESFGSPGLAYLRWPSPLRAGRTVLLRCTVIESRIARSNPLLGILRWRWLLVDRAGDDEVLDTEVTSFFDLAPPAAP